MADFNVGDAVVIRDWYDMEQEFGLTEYGSIECQFHFVEDMREFCGERLVISYIDGRGHVHFKSHVSGMEEYNFSTDMIRHEGDSQYELPEVSVDEFISLIT